MVISKSDEGSLRLVTPHHLSFFIIRPDRANLRVRSVHLSGTEIVERTG